MSVRAKGAVRGALALFLPGMLVMSGCWMPQEAPEDPAEAGRQSLRKALDGLMQSHRADVEVYVRVSGGGIALVDVTTEMRGTHRASAGQSATDLDLPDVSMTTKLPSGNDRVREGAVRVVITKDGTYVRNTLQSSQWRRLPPGAALRRNGIDPSSMGQLVQTTIAREMFLDSGAPLMPTPSPVTTKGQKLQMWTVNCVLAQQCLKESPDARATALKMYPADAITELKLFADAQNRPTRMEIKSEFIVGGPTNVMSVHFRAAFDFHDLGKQVSITPPAA